MFSSLKRDKIAYNQLYFGDLIQIVCFLYCLAYIKTYDSLACLGFMGVWLQFVDEIATTDISTVVADRQSPDLEASDDRDGPYHLLHWPP